MRAVLDFAKLHPRIDALYCDPDVTWCLAALFDSHGDRVQLRITVHEGRTRATRESHIIMHLCEALRD